MSVFGAAFVEAAVRDGRAYRYSMLRTTLLATSLFKNLITNPAGSGINMVIYATTVDSYGSAVANLQSFRGPVGGTLANLPTQAVGVSTATPTGAIIIPLNNTIVRVPKVTVMAGSDSVANGFSGGITTQQKPIYTNAPTKTDETITILGPNSTLGIQLGGGVALDVAYTLLWCEEPI